MNSAAERNAYERLHCFNIYHYVYNADLKKNNRHFHHDFQYDCKNPKVCHMHNFPKVSFILGEQWNKKYLVYLSLESFMSNPRSISVHAVEKLCLRNSAV